MNQSKTWQQVKQQLRDNIRETVIFQKKPNTAVQVRTFYVHPISGWLIEVGFSKVSYPDVWDPEFGVKMATDKAIEDIARWVMRERKT